MKQTIVFFDIDGVIFDSQKFFIDFCERFIQENNLSNDEVSRLKDFIQEVKSEKGFFDPQVFLNKIASQYSISKVSLERLWWDDESFQNCLLVDQGFLKQIQGKAVIGIFSKGEIDFQKKKIEPFNQLINQENIYIFENKIVKINEVLEGYKNYRIYIIDDSLEVLESFKHVDNLVFTALVNKDNKQIVNKDIDIMIENVLQLTSHLT